MDDTNDLPSSLIHQGSEAELEYQRAASLGLLNDYIDTVIVEATETDRAAPASTTVELAEVTRLPDSPDEDQRDFGFVPSDLLGQILRIAYPNGTYSVTEWRGLESEREHFVAGRPTGSWRIVRECVLTKDLDGRVSEIDRDERDLYEERYEMFAGVW